MTRLTVGMLAFPQMQLLDFIAPYDILLSAPEVDVTIVAASHSQSHERIAVRPDADFESAPEFDVLFVPGGRGIGAAIEDAATLRFVAERGARARYVTSVCTGSLVLGAAGLLHGYRATTHWRFTDLLEPLGAVYAEGRIVRDRNRITAGGVTAGVDFGLALIAELLGEPVAETVSLGVEYDPAATFPGHPRTARPEIVASVRERTQGLFDVRRELIERFRIPA